MIDIIITSYKEPKATLRAIQAFLKQKIEQDFRIVVVDPFPEVKDFLKKHITDRRVGFYLDPGEGKSYALNILFEKLGGFDKEDFFILTDGDVFVSENAVSGIVEAFKDKEIGCVTARPASVDSKDDMFGFWSHLLFSGIDKVRRKLSSEKKFFECSGYLFAIRKGVIFDFPIEASEDSVIPYLFWKEGYQIKYLPEVEVYVKNPNTWEDWENQKVRNIKGHENLSKLFPDMPRTKSFWNEIRYGFFHALFYPRNFRQVFWMIKLFYFRLVIYLKAFRQLKEKNAYTDGWREVETESTKPLD